MDINLAIRTINRANDLGVFNMKCLKKEYASTGDMLRSMVDILVDKNTDDIPHWVRRYILMDDQQFQIEKPFAKILVKEFDRKHRRNSVDPFKGLKLY